VRDDPLNPGNEPRALSRRLVVAHFTLSRLGHRVGVVRGDRTTAEISAHTIVVTGAALTADEVHALARWVQAGGRLVWHGIDVTTWGEAATNLIGAAPADMRAPRTEGVRLFGRTWNFSDFPRHVFLEVLPRGARVVAADRAGRPMVLVHRFGQGVVVACLAQPDDTFAARSDDRSARRHWERWYKGMLALAAQPRGSQT
jgi:hypothetical protein